MKFILDTNVYVSAASSELGWKRFEKHVFPLLPFVYLSSVVVFELSLAKKKIEDQVFLNHHIAAVQEAGRLVMPSFEDWKDAASLASGNKLRSYLCDILIGYSARHIGAYLLTFDFKDFIPLSKKLNFQMKRPW